MLFTIHYHYMHLSVFGHVKMKIAVFVQSHQWFTPSHFAHMKKTHKDLMMAECTGIDIFNDVCTSSIAAAAKEQTLILNSTQRQLRINSFFVSSARYKPGKCLLFSWEKITLCCEKKKEKKKHNIEGNVFCLWFSTLIEFFNNAHQKKRT